MKYTYAYKTSDGTRHEATMNAESREAVFQALRQQGIKAIKVVADDGSKANGEVRGVRKRAVAVIAVVVALGVGLIAYVSGTRHSALSTPHSALTSPRHQIYGDPALVQRFEAGDFEGVISNRVNQMLAWFAQPGKLMCPRGLDIRRAATTFAHLLAAETTGSVPTRASSGSVPTIGTTKEMIFADDSREMRELKMIVNGMREELCDYLANGNGTPRSFWRRLNERTVQEMQIYERTRRELEYEKNPAVWETKNDALRRLGLRTIPNEDN